MDNILLLLLRLGAHKKEVSISTGEIGAESEMSQQNASRRLGMLEENGYIRRKGGNITITKRGIEKIMEEYSIIKKALEGKVEIVGTIVEGLGEGKYYMSLEGYRKQIADKLGFDPYPGTLNIRIDEGGREGILTSEPVIISGFSGKDRTYGDIFAFPCRIEDEPGAIIVPLRTSHGPDVIEVIAGFDIRKKKNKRTGDRVRVVL